MLNKELARFYRMMDVIICPSHFETYGNIALEAAACGTPALISPNMGVAEQFRRFGMESNIISFKNTNNVFNKIKNAAEHRVGRELRAELRNNLGSDIIFKELISVFRGL
jgi:Glycosyltransferase